jgi:predicted PurR-regulated permease PerM
MYDLIVDTIHTFMKNGLTLSSLGAVLFLLLKNRKLKRHIQQHLPRMLRNHEEDVLQEIRRDVKAIKSHHGMEEEGWNPVNMSSPTGKPSGPPVAAGSIFSSAARFHVQFVRQFMILNLRRIRINMKEYLKKLGRTKFQTFLVVTIVNITILIAWMMGTQIVETDLNPYMPIINLVVQLLAGIVYQWVEGSIDREAQKQNVYVVNGKEEAADESEESIGDHGPTV